MFKSWWREPRPDEWAKTTEDLQALVYLMRERAGAIAQALEDAADAIEKKIEAQQAGACGYKTEDGRCGDPDRSIDFCIGAACPETGHGSEKAPSHGDMIRSMSDEALARRIAGSVAFCAPGHRPSPACPGSCRECWLEWLRRPQEVERCSTACA